MTFLQGLSEPFLILSGILLTFVLGGVVLPAVWSRRAARRAAALAVLRALLRRFP